MRVTTATRPVSLHLQPTKNPSDSPLNHGVVSMRGELFPLHCDVSQIHITFVPVSTEARLLSVEPGGGTADLSTGVRQCLHQKEAGRPPRPVSWRLLHLSGLYGELPRYYLQIAHGTSFCSACCPLFVFLQSSKLCGRDRDGSLVAGSVAPFSGRVPIRKRSTRPRLRSY